MRVLIGCFFVLAVAMCAAQVRLSVEVGGKQVGTASVSQKIGADGSKSVEIKMDLQSGKQKLTLRSQNSYDKNGAPTRKFMDSNIPGGVLQKQVIVTFDSKGANIVQIDSGKRTTRQIPLVDTAPRANANEFWFVRDKPKPGDEVRAYSFNMDTLSWQIQTVIYRGQKSIKIGEKPVLAHEVVTLGDRPSAAYLDDKGLPWMIESGTMVLKRIEG